MLIISANAPAVKIFAQADVKSEEESFWKISWEEVQQKSAKSAEKSAKWLSD